VPRAKSRPYTNPRRGDKPRQQHRPEVFWTVLKDPCKAQYKPPDEGPEGKDRHAAHGFGGRDSESADCRRGGLGLCVLFAGVNHHVLLDRVRCFQTFQRRKQQVAGCLPVGMDQKLHTIGKGSVHAVKDLIGGDGGNTDIICPVAFGRVIMGSAAPDRTAGNRFYPRCSASAPLSAR